MIEQDRLEAIERLGEAGIGGFGGFEFAPQVVQPLALLRRQPAEDHDRGVFLAFGLQGGIDRVEQGRIAALDFDQIVDQQHFDDPADSDRTHGVFGEDDAEQGQVPGMFGGVFTSRAVGDAIGADDAFQTVGFDKKAQLRAQAGIKHFKPGHGGILPLAHSASTHKLCSAHAAFPSPAPFTGRGDRARRAWWEGGTGG